MNNTTSAQQVQSGLMLGYTVILNTSFKAQTAKWGQMMRTTSKLHLHHPSQMFLISFIGWIRRIFRDFHVAFHTAVNLPQRPEALCLLQSFQLHTETLDMNSCGATDSVCVLWAWSPWTPTLMGCHSATLGFQISVSTQTLCLVVPEVSGYLPLSVYHHPSIWPHVHLEKNLEIHQSTFLPLHSRVFPLKDPASISICGFWKLPQVWELNKGLWHFIGTNALTLFLSHVYLTGYKC